MISKLYRNQFLQNKLLVLGEHLSNNKSINNYFIMRFDPRIKIKNQFNYKQVQGENLLKYIETNLFERN